MPGACLITSTSGPPRPLVSSLSAPLRVTSARLGDPDPCIAAENPAAIDSTETNTTTTPAMPTIATAEELRRAGIVRRFSAMTAVVCRSQRISGPPQRVGDPEPHRPQRRGRARQEAQRQHQRDAERDVARRQPEDGQETAGGVALLHEEPGGCQPEPAADQHDEERFGKNEPEDRASGEAERLQHRKLARP